MRILAVVAGVVALSVGFCHNVTQAGAAGIQAGDPAPYLQEDVTVTNGDVRLAGTLTVPRGTGPFPAVVLVTGSGPQNRDEEVFGFKVFATLADALTRQGIAVLRYDDRGVGGSTGTIPQSTTDDFARDALAAVALLGARQDIARGRIGILGHSEGAMAAAIAAGGSPDVGFVVLLAGPGVPGHVVLRQQAGDAARSQGASPEQVEAILAAHKGVLDRAMAGASRDDLVTASRALIVAQVEALPAAQRALVGDVDAFAAVRAPVAAQSMMTPWMRFFLSFDPATALTRVACPVLVVFGGKDSQVPPSLNRAPVEAALAMNPGVKVVEYPDGNHLFQPATTGLVTEYAALPKAFVPGLVEEIGGWIRGAAAGR